MKRPLAYLTAAWSGEPDVDMELAAHYCRLAYEAGFSPICPLLYLPLFLNDSVPEEHKAGIDMRRDMLRRSHTLIVCGSAVDEDKKLFSQYSLGMKQRLAIALAVMHDPELLILDEPINGLDPIGIAEVRSFIRELCDARGKTILISSHILSEISLLADDIGIIDHGALLEEESLAELEQKSSKHIRFTLSDTAQAARILERNFHENHFSIQDDHNLRLHNLDLPVGKIVTAFVENGLEVSEVHTCEESLEDYFKRVTGGEGIA